MADSFFTSGLTFPIVISSGAPVITTGPDLIKQSIKIILSWPTFTRIFEHTFGSRIFETLEEPNDNVLLNLLEFFTVDALEKWEPRIILLKAKIIRTSHTSVNIELTYKIKELNIQDSLSYTFNY